MEKLTHKEQKERIHNTIKEYRYFLVIVIASIVGLVLLPALEVSDGDMGFVFPKSKVEWFIWAFSRIAVMLLSATIFFSFTNEGKLRASRSDKYKQAEEIMIALSLVRATEKKDPISPFKWDRSVKAKKIATLTVMSVTTFIAFGQLILGFSVQTFLSYLLTIGMGVIFGIMQMYDSEDMWSYGYLEYAEWRQKQYEKEADAKLDVKQAEIEEEVKCPTETVSSNVELITSPEEHSEQPTKKSIFDKLIEGD